MPGFFTAAVLVAVLFQCARLEKEHALASDSPAKALSHSRRARVYKWLGWAFVVVGVVVPLAFILFLLLAGPTAFFSF